MPTEVKPERTTVNIDKDIYDMFSKVASLMNISIRDGANEALQEWCKRNLVTARKKANQLLEG